MHEFHVEQDNYYIHNIIINPLLYIYSILRLLQQTTFENIVAKEEAPAGAISSFATMFSKLSDLKNVHFFQQSFSKCRLLQDCFMGERVNLKHIILSLVGHF